MSPIGATVRRPDAKLGKGKDGAGNKSSFAKVTDFEDGDLVYLSQTVFKKLDLGVLSDDAFRDIGEKATKDMRIAYKANGELSYDKDGKGGADAIVFAKLTTKPDIDFKRFSRGGLMLHEEDEVQNRPKLRCWCSKRNSIRKAIPPGDGAKRTCADLIALSG